VLRAIGRGHALVIANASYTDDGEPLRHPVADARALADQLRSGGFEADVAENLSKQDMRKAVGRFTVNIRRYVWSVPLLLSVWAAARALYPWM
jgi:hypothetical protein